MLCPYCLEEVKEFIQTTARNSKAKLNTCPACHKEVPILYADEYHDYPNVIVNAIGFTQHGKTAYLTALFYELWVRRKFDDGFFAMALDDEDLKTVYDNINRWKKGQLHDANPKVFPRPTIVRLNNLPGRRKNINCSLIVYDTSGEAFLDADGLAEYAHFVQKAPTAMFMISIPDIKTNGDDVAMEMKRLLNIYVMGMSKLGGDTKQQNLVVVYTKADLLQEYTKGDWQDLDKYLKSGWIHPELKVARENFMRNLRMASDRLKEFTAKCLDAHQFISFAEQRFRSVRYSMVSALGAAPDMQSKTLLEKANPRCVLHPIIWKIVKSVLEPRKRGELSSTLLD